MSEGDVLVEIFDGATKRMRATHSPTGTCVEGLVQSAEQCDKLMANLANHVALKLAAPTPTELCSCFQSTLEDQGGNVLWRAADGSEWCGELGNPWVDRAGRFHQEDGWCDLCIDKACPWCHGE